MASSGRAEPQTRPGSTAVSLDGRGTVTLPGDYVTDNVALAYAVTVHKGQGLTVDNAVLVVDRATAAEHLYVGMTRGRHHNLACVITEPAGDEHQHSQPVAAADVLAAALRKTSNQKSATETLRDELDHPGGGTPRWDAIVEGLRQTQAHTNRHDQIIRREAARQALPPTERSPAPQRNVYQGREV